MPVQAKNAEVIYLSNRFPSAVEPYVSDEMGELRRRGITVTPWSVWPLKHNASNKTDTVFTWRPWLWLSALLICVQCRQDIQDIIRRIFQTGPESWGQRLRALGHTLLGARLALLLRNKGVRHIHVHHGYLGAWIAMVAARLLRISYSITLHGSDLLLRSTFLDIKLQHCAICFTISEFNSNYLIQHYPQINPRNVLLSYVGVHVSLMQQRKSRNRSRSGRPFTLLAVGRLHAVKDHAFLLRACAALKGAGDGISCQIAGTGPERRRLEALIRSLGLRDNVQLLGHVQRSDLADLYRDADLVVLTSQSEGIPLTLMEAMALGRPVLAPNITGIPELVQDGKTGFLYRPGSITDFVDRVQLIRNTYSGLGPICDAAHDHVHGFFNLETNLQQFSKVFLDRILGYQESVNANSLLQQVQL